MTCAVCGHCPGPFVLFGGHYWQRLGPDHLCPVCFAWATALLW